ncbi:DMT family transporter [Winogradskyella undariae]|uniref:DMT family transporter n=1 Tax=Winogradskyella undariae TaxID=1285465 RepID=UPI00156B07D5|nr:DMT family transporter [Winogradskyella undariae]NRR92876.1 DMT family transporter [Winogradskyella undariae]
MKVRQTFLSGIILGIIGIVLFSSKAVLIKLAYQYNIDALSMLQLRMLFSFPFYIVIAYLYRNEEKEDIQRQDYLWLIFFGFVGYYLASYFDFIGLTYIKASLERIILFIYPTIVLLFNKWFLKKVITNKQKLAIIITYVGIIITFASEVSVSGSETYLGGLFVFLSAVTYAAYLMGSGWLIPKFGVMRFTAYAMIVCSICVFVHFSIFSEVDIFSFPWQVYALGLCIAIFATVIPSFLVSISIKLISSSNFAIVAGIGPISTIILAVIFLNESLTTIQIIGTVVVILGILLVSKKKRKKKRQD